MSLLQDSWQSMLVELQDSWQSLRFSKTGKSHLNYVIQPGYSIQIFQFWFC